MAVLTWCGGPTGEWRTANNWNVEGARPGELLHRVPAAGDIVHLSRNTEVTLYGLEGSPVVSIDVLTFTSGSKLNIFTEDVGRNTVKPLTLNIARSLTVGRDDINDPMAGLNPAYSILHIFGLGEISPIVNVGGLARIGQFSDVKLFLGELNAANITQHTRSNLEVTDYSSIHATEDMHFGGFVQIVGNSSVTAVGNITMVGRRVEMTSSASVMTANNITISHEGEFFFNSGTVSTNLLRVADIGRGSTLQIRDTANLVGNLQIEKNLRFASNASQLNITGNYTEVAGSSIYHVVNGGNSTVAITGTGTLAGLLHVNFINVNVPRDRPQPLWFNFIINNNANAVFAGAWSNNPASFNNQYPEDWLIFNEFNLTARAGIVRTNRIRNVSITPDAVSTQETQLCNINDDNADFMSLNVTDILVDGVSAPYFNVNSKNQIEFTTPTHAAANNLNVTIKYEAQSGVYTESYDYMLDYVTHPILLTSTDAISKYGTSVSFIADPVASPTGNASFILDGGTPVSVAFVGSTATYTPINLSPGTHKIEVSVPVAKGTANTYITQVVLSETEMTFDPSYEFGVNTYNDFTITSTGFPGASYSISGLPEGLTANQDGYGNLMVSGTPVEGTGGTYTISVSAEGPLTTDTQEFEINVLEGAKWVESNTQEGTYVKTANTGMYLTVTASGNPGGGDITLTHYSGSLPSGVTFTDNNDGTAFFSGVPASTGNYTVVIKADNGIGSPAYLTYTIKVLAAPYIVSVTPNGNISALTGGMNGASQRSRVASLVVVFSAEVILAPNAFYLSLHTNGVSFNGTSYSNGYGSLPTSLNVSTSNNITYVITFSGNTDGGADGFASIKDGVYDLHFEGSGIALATVPLQTLFSDLPKFTFYRLFGNGNGEYTPSGGTAGVNFGAIVNSTDNGGSTGFAAASNPIYYHAWWDFNGDGVRNATDSTYFNANFNKELLWTI